MYPHTDFKLVDNSELVESAESNLDAPLFMYAITSDKGPEEMKKVVYDDLELLYGKVSFAKHGQAQLQAARSAQAGANVLIKRIVAPDAYLANVVIVAKVKTVQEQKLNSLGEPLYDNAGVETTDSTIAGVTPIMIDVAEVKYEAQTVTNVSTVAEVAANAETMYSDTPDVDGYKTYPLFVLTDVGRGTSNKKFRISANFAESKRYDYVLYQLDVIESTTVLETLNFSFDYEKITNNMNYSLSSIVNNYSNQVKSQVLEVYVDNFLEELETIGGVTAAELLGMDVLFGNTKDNKTLQAVKIADASLSLDHLYGINLDSGTNGAFGSRPSASPDLETELVKFFSGQLDNNIYDLDQYKIDAVVDANYPAAVKRAIEDLADFRGDFFFFRDMGFVNTYESIAAVQLSETPSMYAASYMNSFDVVDPYSKKQIPVTMGYTLSKMLVSHFKNGRHRPVAGRINDAILSDAIKGTVNYLPKVTPGVNQKEELVDIRVNYASYFDDELIVETQYTSQLKYSQFSFVNNILAIQEVIKAIRTKCPKIRYSFIEGEDLEEYRKDVEAVINKYIDNFSEINFKYLKDETAIQNKQFKAAIEVKFKNYAESEYFTIYAIN